MCSLQGVEAQPDHLSAFSNLGLGVWVFLPSVCLRIEKIRDFLLFVSHSCAQHPIHLSAQTFSQLLTGSCRHRGSCLGPLVKQCTLL